MSCSDRYATPQDFEDFMCASLDLTDLDVVTSIENALDLAASDIHVTLAQVGACDCTLADWAVPYLKKLNILDAAVVQNCHCTANIISDDRREMFLMWLERQYELIRTGKIDVCQNSTGAQYPAYGIIQQGWTDWSDAEIAYNEIMSRL